MEKLIYEIEHSLAIRMRKIIEHKTLHEVFAWQNAPVVVGQFCVGNFRDILFTPGIQDI